MGLAKLGASGWLAQAFSPVSRVGRSSTRALSRSTSRASPSPVAWTARWLPMRSARLAPQRPPLPPLPPTPPTPRPGSPVTTGAAVSSPPRAGRSPSGASSSSARPSSPPRRPSPTSTPTPPPPTPPCPPGGPPRVAYRLCGASRSRPGLDPPVASGSARALFLAAESVALAGAHGQLRAAVHAVPLRLLLLPPSLSLHFRMDHRRDGAQPQLFRRRRGRVAANEDHHRARLRVGIPRRGYHRHGHLGRPRVRADARVGARGGGGGWRKSATETFDRSRLANVSRETPRGRRDRSSPSRRSSRSRRCSERKRR